MKWRRLAPLREIRIVRNGMRRLFVKQRRPQPDDSIAITHWGPAVGFYESDSELVVNLDLLSLDPNTIDIRVENNVLTIRGERQTVVKRFSDGFESAKTPPAFTRSFTLSTSVDPGQIRTDYQDGVFRITLPKTEAMHRMMNAASDENSLAGRNTISQSEYLNGGSLALRETHLHGR